MPIGRLFYEIGGDTSRLNESLREAIEIAKEAGVKITGAGQSFIAKFDEALNPTKALAEQLRLLEAAGKPTSDIMAVLGDKIRAATEVARAHGQPVAEIVARYAELASKGGEARGIFEALGQTIIDFARNPIGSLQGGLTSVLSSIGPVGVGIGAVAGAAVAAGTAIFSMAARAGEMAERLENLAARTGLSTTMIQGMQAAAEQMGLSGEALVGGLDRLNKQLALPGGGEFGHAMELMGVALKDSEGRMRPVQEILVDFNERLNAIQDPAERATTAMGALGRGNEDLATAMLASTENFMALAQAMGEQHGYSEQQLEDMAALDDKLDVLALAWDDIKRAVTTVAVAIANFALEAVGHIGGVVGWLGKLVAHVPGLEGLGKNIEGLGRSMAEWKEKAEAQVRAERSLHEAGQKSLGQLRELERAQKEKAKAIKEANDKYEKMVEELDKLAPKYKQLTTNTEVLTDRLFAMTQLAVRDMIAGLGDEIRAADDKMKAFSTTARGLVEDKSGLRDLNVDLSASKTNMDALGTSFGDADDKAKSFSGTMREEVSTVFTNLEQKLVDNLLKWNDWKSGLLSIAEDFAKAMMSKIVEFLFAPLERQMGEIAGKIGGWLSGVLGGGGGGGGAAGAAAGGAAQAAGGAASAVSATAGAFANWGTGLIAGGLSAAGSIIGASLVRRDTFEIEINTRYTQLYCAEILRVAQEHTGMWWHFNDVWGDHFEWIHTHTRETAERIDELYYLLAERLPESGRQPIALTVNIDGREITKKVLDDIAANRFGARDAILKALPA